MNKKIYIFTSEFKSENGQAVVTRRVVTKILPQIQETVSCIYNSGLGIQSIKSWISACFLLWKGYFNNNIKAIYLVCSRTMLGFMRDVPCLLMASFGQRVIVHCHGSDFSHLLTERWYSGLARLLYRNCEVIVPCKHLATTINKEIPKTHLCENFFAGIDEVSTEVISNHSGLVVIWNSNLMSSKGFFDVVSAIETLVASGLEIQFICYGRVVSDHEMSEAKIWHRLAKYKNRSWFCYLGVLEHSMAIQKLKQADVVILPSRYPSEMQPLAVIEGMCAAKHIIISNIASLRKTVGDYPALFVQIGDVSAIAETIKKLYSAKQNAFSKFFQNTKLASVEAKKRFSKERFDLEMKKIIYCEEKL